MKLGEICSPISGNQSTSTSKNESMGIGAKKSREIGTGLTGEFIGIRLESLESPTSDRQYTNQTHLSPLTATSVDVSDDSRRPHDDAEPLTHQPVPSILPENAIVKSYRRRFEMLKCSSAHNILKAPVAFVNKNNARISLSPIQGANKSVIGLKPLPQNDIKDQSNKN